MILNWTKPSIPYQTIFTCTDFLVYKAPTFHLPQTLVSVTAPVHAVFEHTLDWNAFSTLLWKTKQLISCKATHCLLKQLKTKILKEILGYSMSCCWEWYWAREKKKRGQMERNFSCFNINHYKVPHKIKDGSV